ncbi:double-strand break repair protein AddB [Gluconacetobacter diazotrophicus]|uniref:Double-strand break repair protein AddB n=1 Tax=Gluconacetobacter diazotrophicus TaxID=33996 RepID=A0A7W4I672_GLUDI|nr:double-strand break repair protein AddB [Gluconacetobacter diazotrophicus]MBB2156994.1 double-strand break repair protein AddB [Gluconacetobacter diazotrophicus]TWB07647.1 ATP-dependent helicase/nuclease subunit B [Gluconacetobacter diazotrophicus]
MSDVVTIPPHVPFLDAVATRWMAEIADDPQRSGDGLILLPSRRAARALTEAFLRHADGRPMLLPRIAPIGSLDESALALSGQEALDLPPAVEPLRRLATLTRLILQAGDAFGDVRTIDQAWPLAQALAELMDDAEWAECDLAERLPAAAEGDFAEHWHLTLRFLSIVTGIWPAWLAEEGVMNPAARQVALLHAQARRWHASPLPGGERLWAVGFTDAMPSVLAVLDAVLAMPGGRLVLPGVDLSLDEASWTALPDGHPQAGIARLLAGVGRNRADLAQWGDPPHDAGSGDAGMACPVDRGAVLARALLPAAALGEWLRDTTPVAMDGLSVLRAADQQEEAAAIALLLRQAIAEPGHRAALVTPDRGLAGRVAVELARWGVVADDSAGEPLGATPPAIFLRLVVQAATGGLSPVALLSLLKHPLAACGLSPGACRASARLLERALLRGPAPRPGIDGLRDRLAVARDDAHGALADRPDAPEDLAGFVDRVERCLAPLLTLVAAPAPGPVADLLAGLVEAAEALATTDDRAGADRLWAGEDGNVLGQHLAALIAFCDVLPAQGATILDGLLAASMAGQTVRSRRGLRGRDATALHPRIFIWGLMEARLQAVETMVLGALVETVWPPATDPGPWMSRPMRARVGLPSPERAIGQAAHDFVACACAAPRVVLSVPGRRDGAPTVPARWLVRLDAFLAGRDQALAAHPALSWLSRLDRPVDAPRPVAPPRPRPPLAARPRALTITEIETWMRDPYAIHARHILGLRRLKEIEEPADAADYGTIVHAALDRWFRQPAERRSAAGEAGLRATFAEELAAARLRPALAAWWAPRLARIAAWVVQAEAARASGQAGAVVTRTERSGTVELSGLPGGPFVLRGRADRIDRNGDGGLTLIDYKTGTLPRRKSVFAGWSSQLVLEAAMAERGAFGAELVGRARELLYWRLTGGPEAGEDLPVATGQELDDLIAASWDNLRGLIAMYDDPAQPYLSHPRPEEGPRFADYARLARVAEWSAARDEAGS